MRNEKSNGDEITNYLAASVSKDGTFSYLISDPAAFRSAIGIEHVLRYLGSLPANTNLNNLTDALGIYSIGDLSKIINAPSGANNWGTLLLLYGLQIYLGYTSGTSIFVRRWTGTNFEQWVKFTGTRI